MCQALGKMLNQWSAYASVSNGLMRDHGQASPPSCYGDQVSGLLSKLHSEQAVCQRWD